MRQDSTTESVRQRYAELATNAAPGAICCTPDEQAVFGASRYANDDLDAVPETAVAASLGCGNPTAVAGLAQGDIVLDLGSGGGIEAGVTNVEFLNGHIERVPLPDAHVDVVISNCVINLSTDKAAVIAEAARVLRPGGRFAVSDVIADPDMDDTTRAEVEQWTGCVAGALTREDYSRLLQAAGLTDVEIIESHRVHAHASSAIIRARKPTEGFSPSRP